MADKDRRIIVGADHYGLLLKGIIRDYLRDKGYMVDDAGVYAEDPVDYPDIGWPVAEVVSRGEYELGILVCGTGAGMAIVANKVPGIRAVCISDSYTAERARGSNDAQIVTLGSRIIEPEVAKKLIDIWLESQFQGGRSAQKVEKINQLDEKYRQVRVDEEISPT
jgi:ribose 5-phosphate isomerase B